MRGVGGGGRVSPEEGAAPCVTEAEESRSLSSLIRFGAKSSGDSIINGGSAVCRNRKGSACEIRRTTEKDQRLNLFLSPSSPHVSSWGKSRRAP